MARMPLSKKKQIVGACVTIYSEMIKKITELLIEILHSFVQLHLKIPKQINFLFDNSIDDRLQARFLNIKSIIQISDQVCINNIRMDRNCFDNLCGMLRDIGGLRGNRNMDTAEMVALFLYTLAHNKKNRTIQVFFRRSAETVSRHFTCVLNAVEEIANDEESNLYQQAGQQKDNLEDEVSPRNVQPTDTGARGSKRIKTDSLKIVKELTFGLQKISNVMETGNENIAKLTSCFQHESDGANKRMMVNSELLKIEGLSPDQFIKVGRKIALDPLETDYFFSLPEDYRSTYVQALLLPDS